MSSSPATVVASLCKRVLLVEDDAGTAELVRRTLERAGYAVEVANGVESGLKALRNHESDDIAALLLDYRLPDGEPWVVADAAQARIPEVPVVFVTGMSDENVAIEALRRGFADYVKKTDGFWRELPVVLERVARLNHIKGRLDETNALMSAVVEHSSDLIAVASGEGRLVYLSPVCLSLLGKSSLEMAGEPWTEIVIAEDRAALLTMLACADENPSQMATLRCSRNGDSPAWVEARVARLRVTTSTQSMIVLTLHDVTAQREHEQQMQASLREKEVLLREIHHRVKNNLQVVQSLLKMSIRALPPGEARKVTETTIQRVHAMAMVHERLYQMPDLAGLSVPSYLRDIFSGVVASQSTHPGQFKLQLDADEILLNLDRAIPFGLLANELISNSLKHGYSEDRKGVIKLSVHRMPNAVRLIVKDNGVGLPENFDPSQSSSMGLKLAASLAHQLGGNLEFSSNKGCQVQSDLTRL